MVVDRTVFDYFMFYWLLVEGTMVDGIPAEVLLVVWLTGWLKIFNGWLVTVLYLPEANCLLFIILYNEFSITMQV